jgi:hypothetical protein
MGKYLDFPLPLVNLDNDHNHVYMYTVTSHMCIGISFLHNYAHTCFS